HALLRDGVYTALLERDRLALHGRAAAWFDGRDPVRYADQLDRAGDPRAAAAYEAAARHEATHARLERAERLAERGIALAESDAALRAALRGQRADWLLELGRADAALAEFEAVRHTARDDASLCRAETGIAACLRVHERHADALAA